MATSGSSSMSFNSGHHRFIVEWSTKSQSVPNNNSLVNVKVFLQSVDQWGTFYAPASNSGSLTVNGSTTKWTATSDLSANQKKLLFAKDYTIGHNSDGTKVFSFSASYTVNVTYSGVYLGLVQTGSNGTLNTIPRKSDVALSSANINFGDSTTIKVTKKSSGFTSTLRFNWGSSQQTIVSKTASTSVAFTPDKSLMQYISNNKSGWGTVYCDTYSGSTLIGTNSVKLTLNVPNNSSYTPIISSVALSENNSAVTTAVGATYLQDKSRVKVTTTASGQWYATIASVSVKIGTNSTFTGNPAISGAITETGNSIPVVVTVTDSRGYTATNSQTIAILPYTNPTSTIKVARRETEQEIVDIVWSGKTKAVGTANDMGYKLEYRVSGGTWTSIATGGNATTETWGATKVQDSIDIDKAYEFRINVYDEFMTSQATQSVSVATVPMSWGKQGSSVGKVYQEGGATFQVGGNMSINGKLLIDIFYPVGTIYESTSSTNPSSFIGGSWERYGNGRVTVGLAEGDGDFDSVGETGGEKFHTLSKGEVPNIGGSIQFHGAGAGLGTVVSGVSGVFSSSQTQNNYHTNASTTGAWSAGTVGFNAGYGGGSHNNLQPYITVYRFRRTA